MSNKYTFKFTPLCCQGDDKTYEGHIVLRVPSIDERLDLMSRIGVEINKDGEIELPKAQLLMSKNLISESWKFYEEVKLKCIADGQEFGSVDDLKFYPQLTSIATEVSRLLLNGIRPGKN